MVAPINFDLNADGVVNATDIQLAQAQGINVPQEVLDFVNQNPVQEANNVAVVDPAALPTNTLNDIKTALTTLKELLATGQQTIADADAEIATLKPEQAEATQELLEAQAEYVQNAAQIDQLNKDLTDSIKMAVLSSENITADQNRAIGKAVSDATAEFNSGEYEGQTLQQVIDYKLNKVGIDTSSLDNLMQRSDGIGAVIKQKCGTLADLGAKVRDCSINLAGINDRIDVLNVKKADATANVNAANAQMPALEAKHTQMVQDIINKYKVPATEGVDPATSGNAQVQKLDEFLKNGELNTIPIEDAYEILATSFDSVIQVQDGKLVVPQGHDPAAVAIFQNLVDTVKQLYGDDLGRNGETTADISRTDPIGFNVGNTKYDFVVDKDKDGIFDNKNEFVGAKDGFNEMLQYDTNNDGVIKNDELKNLEVLQTAADGKSTFANAAELGIDKIDLASYTKQNKDIGNNNILAGNFNLTFKGQNITGEQTLDTDAFLNSKYGNAFGQKINQDQPTSSAQNIKVNMSNANPFGHELEISARLKAENADTVLGQAKRIIGDKIDQSNEKKDNIFVSDSTIIKKEKKEENVKK